MNEVHAAPPCAECHDQRCRCEFTTETRHAEHWFTCSACHREQAPQAAAFHFRRPPGGAWRVYARTCLPCILRERKGGE